MKKIEKKFSLGNVSDTLSDNQLKRVIGGYEYSGCMKITCYNNGGGYKGKVIGGTINCFDFEDQCSEGLLCEPC